MNESDQRKMNHVKGVVAMETIGVKTRKYMQHLGKEI